MIICAFLCRGTHSDGLTAIRRSAREEETQSRAQVQWKLRACVEDLTVCFHRLHAASQHLHVPGPCDVRLYWRRRALNTTRLAS